MKSVEVAGRLLRALMTANGPLALHDICRCARMQPSTAHRYLTSLVKVGLVDQNLDDRRYGLGRLALELGAAAARRSEPLTEAIDKLQQLRAVADETFSLSIWSAGGPLVFQVEDGSRPIVMTMKRGTLLPLLSTATGIVFTALLPRPQTERLIVQELQEADVLTPMARNHEELDALLARVRRQGFALNTGHLMQDISALAAPIYDASDRLVAVIGVFGRDDRINPERSPRLLDTLLRITRS